MTHIKLRVRLQSSWEFVTCTSSAHESGQSFSGFRYGMQKKKMPEFAHGPLVFMTLFWPWTQNFEVVVFSLGLAFKINGALARIPLLSPFPRKRLPGRFHPTFPRGYRDFPIFFHWKGKGLLRHLNRISRDRSIGLSKPSSFPTALPDPLHGPDNRKDPSHCKQALLRFQFY